MVLMSCAKRMRTKNECSWGAHYRDVSLAGELVRRHAWQYIGARREGIGDADDYVTI